MRSTSYGGLRSRRVEHKNVAHLWCKARGVVVSAPAMNCAPSPVCVCVLFDNISHS